MRPSLKFFAPGLARLLNTTTPKIYERAHALTRAGILTSRGGLGPGSGTAATAPSVALWLIAILGAETLGQTESRTRELAAMPPAGFDRCPFTGTKTFADAFTNIISSRARAASVFEISISRTASRAVIVYRDRETREKRTVEFIGSSSMEPVLKIVATLDGSAIRQIAADVIDVLLAPDDLDPIEQPRRGRISAQREVIEDEPAEPADAD